MTISIAGFGYYILEVRSVALLIDGMIVVLYQDKRFRVTNVNPPGKCGIIKVMGSAGVVKQILSYKMGLQQLQANKPVRYELILPIVQRFKMPALIFDPKPKACR